MNRYQYGEAEEGADRFIGFYISNKYSMLPFISAVEPLRIANRNSRNPLYQWTVVTENGESVFAINGFELAPKYAVDNTPDFSIKFVSGPHELKIFIPAHPEMADTTK